MYGAGTDTTDGAAGLKFNGEAPDASSIIPGDATVFCYYPTVPVPGDPWEFTGATIVFEDGRPGIPSTGVCLPDGG